MIVPLEMFVPKTKPKEEIKNDWNRAIPKNPGVQSTWTCPDKNCKGAMNNLFLG